LRRLPPLTAIEAFVQVARLGSVKAAASELSLSSPALSRRVQALERFLGHALFDRGHQTMALNEEGEQLLSRIAPALDMLTDAIEATTGDGELMRLRLSIAPLFASQRIMPHLADLRSRYPDLHLDITTTATGLTRLGDGLDAAICIQREVDSSFYSKRIERGRISLIGARSFVESLTAPFRPEDIAKHTILVHAQMMDAFEAWRASAGIPNVEPAAIDRFDSGQLMLEAAAEGIGIALMLDGHLAAAGDPRLVNLSTVDVESPYSYWFACRRSALSTRAVRLFHDWLFDILGSADDKIIAAAAQ
jgi:LysR family glycine cleavage system transcriptional activator